MPQIVKTPQGTLTFPDDATPEEITAAVNGAVEAPASGFSKMHTLSQGLGAVSSVARGGLQGVHALVDWLGSGQLDPNTLKPVPSSTAVALQKWTDEHFPAQNGLGSRALEGAGMMAAGDAKSAIPRLLAGVGANTAASATGDLLTKANAPDWLNKSLTFGAGLLGGGIGSMAGGPQTAAEGALRRATGGMSPEDWQAASENLGKYASSGATTGTLPEMFPGNTRLLTLALEARNSRGGERLSSQVAKRNADLAGLTNRAIEVSGEPGVPADVTNQARTTANLVIDRAKKERSGAYSSTVAGASVDPTVISTLRDLFLKNAKAAESEVEKDAYLAAARALTDANPGTAVKTSIVPGTPIGEAGFRTKNQTVQTEVPVDQPKTSLEAIAKDLKQMQERVNDLNLTGGQKLDKGAVSRRYGEVQDVLKALSPEYQRAEAGYKATSENVVDPLISGPIGDLSGRNPNSHVDPAASILSNLVKDQTPESIPGVMSTLASGTQLPSQLLPQIARTLVAQKLQKGPLNASQAIRGTPGSAEEANVVALLKGANVDPKPLLDTLDTSALLQTPQFRSAPSTTGEVPQATMGMRIPNVARIASGLSDKFLGTTIQNRYYRQISDLLADPSPQALAKLQEIAMYDPQVRKQVAIRAALGASANQEQ